jgi:hypothetical protein
MELVNSVSVITVLIDQLSGSSSIASEMNAGDA